MKRPTTCLIILVLILGINSCKKESSYKTYNLSEIAGKAKVITEKELDAVIEYTQLETTPQSLIADIMDLVVTDKYYFILSSAQQVLQFSRGGKFIRQISMMGNGPGEHRQILNIFVNEKRERIFLAEIFGRIMEYDFDGVFMGEHKKGESMSRYIFDQDDNLYESIQVIMGNEPVRLRVMKMDGDTLKNFENHLKYAFTQSAAAASYADYKSMFELEGKIVYHQISTDTVFTYNKSSMSLRPRYCFNNPGGPKPDDFTNFMERVKDLTLIYDVAEDKNYIYATIVSPGWKKDLYMIDKDRGGYYLLNFCLSSDPVRHFIPKWQYGINLIDYVYRQNDANPELVFLTVKGVL